MPGLHLARRLLITTAALMGLAFAAHAQAQRMVSIQGSVVNMRSAPGTGSQVLWELDRGYPLQVIGQRGNWLQVRDFERDTGWVLRRLTGKVPHHIVKASVANVRKGPGTQHAVVGKAARGELVRTLAKRSGWVRVKRDGGQTGWIAKGLLWGW
jgi:uncharacterized protein YgiM (DUF1202 family)